jgi:hypothetical protein
VRATRKQSGSRLFEIAPVLVRLDHVASFIMNANNSITNRRVRELAGLIQLVVHRGGGKRLVVRAADPPHGRGVLRGAKVGNGVAVGEGVAVAAGIGVATCACAPAKKATKPTRTHTLRKAIPDRIRVLAAGCGT